MPKLATRQGPRKTFEMVEMTMHAAEGLDRCIVISCYSFMRREELMVDEWCRIILRSLGPLKA